MRKQTNISDSTRTIAGISVFSAFAFCVALVTNIPVGFLTFDAKDTIITIASFIYGPVSAVIMSAITAIMEAITVGNTGPWGALMDFISTASFTVTASLIYKYRRTYNGALIAYFCAIISTTGVMLVLNRFVTPIYLVEFFGMPKAVATQNVIDMLANVLLPFNFAKALMNSAIAMILYKPIANALRRTNLVKGKTMGTKFGKQSIITIIVGALSLAAAIVAFVIIS